jgi:hypothetical protein
MAAESARHSPIQVFPVLRRYTNHALHSGNWLVLPRLAGTRLQIAGGQNPHADIRRRSAVRPRSTEMPRPEKLSQLELLERHKRIPKKTQETLSKMISRRFAELCGVTHSDGHQARQAAKTFPHAVQLHLKQGSDHEPQLEKADS